MTKAVIEATARMECLLQRVSETGACLRIPASCEIPAEFFLNIEGETTPRYCAIAARKPTQTNVYFV